MRAQKGLRVRWGSIRKARGGTMNTEIKKIKGSWEEVVDDCRATVGKPPLGHEPSEDFKRRILICRAWADPHDLGQVDVERNQELDCYALV